MDLMRDLYFIKRKNNTFGHRHLVYAYYGKLKRIAWNTPSIIQTMDSKPLLLTHAKAKALVKELKRSDEGAHYYVLERTRVAS